MMLRSFIARFLTAVSVAASLLALAPQAAAQAFPTKQPIRLIIPAAPGGGTDAIGRILAEALGNLLKQQVVVDNKAGASGIVGSEILARAPNDGYTLMMVQNGHTMNPALYKKIPYDTFNDFTPITTLGRTPLVLIAAAPTGVKSVKDLVDLGRRQPAAMSFASAEASTRLAAEMISDAIKLPVTIANYRGTGPAVVDVAGGHINFAVTTIASTLSQRGSGKINYLAVLAANRSPYLPEVPTLAEQGVADVESLGWWGVLAPANLPKSLVAELNAAIRSAMSSPEVRQRLATLSAEPWMGSPEEFERFIRNEVASTLRVAKKAGIEPE